MDLVEEAAAFRLEGAVRGAGRAAGIGAGGKALAAAALGVVADRQVARDEIDLFPIIVHEGRGREDAGLEPQEPGPAAAAPRLVEGAGENFLRDAGRIAGRRLPAPLHVHGVEFEMRLVDGHGGISSAAEPTLFSAPAVLSRPAADKRRKPCAALSSRASGSSS